MYGTVARSLFYIDIWNSSFVFIFFEFESFVLSGVEIYGGKGIFELVCELHLNETWGIMAFDVYLLSFLAHPFFVYLDDLFFWDEIVFVVLAVSKLEN